MRPHPRSPAPRGRKPARAFTLIEIMIVVGIMGLVMSMGIPAIYRLWDRHGIGKAVEDVTTTCVNARARAIFSGKTATVVFHPREKRFEVEGEGLGPKSPASTGESAGEFDNDIGIEMLDVNLLEYNESESARVRFFPNGTSDEMTLILRSSKNEWVKISLEITTGLATSGPVQP